MLRLLSSLYVSRRVCFTKNGKAVERKKKKKKKRFFFFFFFFFFVFYILLPLRCFQESATVYE